MSVVWSLLLSHSLHEPCTDLAISGELLGLPAYMCVAVWRCECFVVHVVLARQVLRLTHLPVWACWQCIYPALAIHCCCSVTLSQSDMTFAWKQLEGVTYQCSFNGQAAEDCELSAALEASLPSLHVVEH